MQKIDANIVLRYLLNDHEECSPLAREIIDKNIVEVPVEVLCEVVYVLTGNYEIDRKTVSLNLKYFFDQTRCNLPHRQAILRGLEYFGENLVTSCRTSMRWKLRCEDGRFLISIIWFHIE